MGFSEKKKLHFKRLWWAGAPLLVGLAALAGTEGLRVGKGKSCQQNLRAISQAIAMYAADAGGLYPPCAKIHQREYPDWQLHHLLRSYVKTAQVFHCPADTGVPGTGSKSAFEFFGSSYQVYGWEDAQARKLPYPTPLSDLKKFSDKQGSLLRDATGWHGGGATGFNVLYADGSVKFYNQPDDGGIK